MTKPDGARARTCAFVGIKLEKMIFLLDFIRLFIKKLRKDFHLLISTSYRADYN